MQNPPSGSPSSRNGNVPLRQLADGDRRALVARLERPDAQKRQCPHGGQEAGDDVVAGRHARDARPDGLDDAGALVAADDRVPPAGVGVPQVLVGVAQPGVGHLDQHLARPGVEDLELDDLVLGLRPAQNRCSRRPHGRPLLVSTACVLPPCCLACTDADHTGLDPRAAGRCGTIGACPPTAPAGAARTEACPGCGAVLAPAGRAARRRREPRRPAPGCSR